MAANNDNDNALIPHIIFEDFVENSPISKEAIRRFKDTGLLIVEDVFSPEECNNYCSEIISCFCKISPNLKVDLNTGQPDLSTWIPENLPPGPRSGLFQSLVSAFPPVRQIRRDQKILKIFELVYSDLRDKEIEGYDSFYSSMDGINVRPFMKPFQKKQEDWAHLDQTIYDNPFLCVQGQVVLSNTSACFRASPKSLHVHNQVLDMNGIAQNDSSNWLKFPKSDYRMLQECVESVGGKWQIPIRAKKGSVILWTSSTVHSAMIQQQQSKFGPTAGDPWVDWRFVVYTCYRPKTDVALNQRKRHENRLKKCQEENRVTNHWGEQIFPKKVFRDYHVREKTLAMIVEDPKKLDEYFFVAKEKQK